ncbi:MAG: hypothetical protein KZQ66_17050 [Candidatus Thiodiazotropha sp. (ex Lucinoma aequizonata)]|nr:hypothetical protein [Candidatus Thiodiazotropha sp. (ex Lucinoma aequizonata)]MCU7889232.1 hypothetical protein [Candidatus Thiodiazotropha sp. (ex Lucinoma aequizonata)]MCU7895980.1 hypothetical protein [Candidatus Thiodiazotropha sp. (ex Lucinoma aequizonata)]MCU7897806.1 hypothetical protein [Candidatus Thiodiazotropha sp. (ex Lucinoma aequizonata)]MCU7903482.1 hypothetical protein [Candidatus Thiodiazotropha sp. (ex Lucinoma aequizonata)]
MRVTVQTLSRAATEIEKNSLYRVNDALNLEADDSLWMVLMTLDYYVALYEKIPKELAGATEPLRELGNAPAILQALKNSTKATKEAEGLWTTLTARGLAWGLAVGLGLGIMFDLVVLRDLWVDYEQWNLENQVVAMEKQRAEIGASYEALKGWKNLGLTVTPATILVDKSDDIITDESGSGKVTGIWVQP